jgi:hypothetical protein
MSNAIAVVLCNFNRRALLEDCLRSVHAQTVHIAEVIVWDNASTDGSAEMVEREFGGKVTLLRGTDNLGSAGGLHAGLAHALETPGDRFLLLDSDVVLRPDTAERLSAFLDRHPRSGVVGPKVYDLGSLTTVQSLGGRIDWSRADVMVHRAGHDERRSGSLDERPEVDFVPACCAMTRRRVIEQAGSFDPGLFLYWDDVEWQLRVRRAGYQVHAISDTAVSHHGGSTHKGSLVPIFYGWRNRVAFMRRHSPVTRRDDAVRACVEDAVRAAFTCRLFDRPRAATMIERGVQAGLHEETGRADFTGLDTRLDEAHHNELPCQRSPAEMTIHVDHILGDVEPELARRPGLLLRDRHDHVLPATVAWQMRQRFETERAARVGHLLHTSRRPA